MKDRRGKGFTLIELIIVIAVITLLIGLALPRLRGMIDRGNKAKAGAELKALQAAVESYYVENKAYPPDGSATWQSALIAARPQLIGSALLDPFSASGVQYQYDKSANGLYYIIWSIGPDAAADISGVDNSGHLTGTADDDVYVSNGLSGIGGF